VAITKPQGKAGTTREKQKPANCRFAGCGLTMTLGRIYRLPSDTGSDVPGVVPWVWPELLISGPESEPAPDPLAPLMPPDPLMVDPPPEPASPDMADRIWLHPASEANARMATSAREVDEK
jgi:hypothetical protein